MKNKTVKLIALVVVGVVLMGGFMVTVYALECGVGYQESGGMCYPSDSGLPDPTSDNPVTLIITNIMKWLLGIFGVLAIISFAVSGVQYLLSAGDKGKMDTAKRHMIFSVIGVVVGLMGYIIIQAIDTLLRGQSATF